MSSDRSQLKKCNSMYMSLSTEVRKNLLGTIITKYPGETVFHIAIRSCLVYGLNNEDNMLKKIDALLDLGFGKFVNVKNTHSGKTPLHYAVTHSLARVVAKLISINKKVLHMRDRQGRFPLHCVGGYKRSEIIEILVKSGSLVDSLDNNGRTLMHYAAADLNIWTIQQLLRLGSKGLVLRDNYGKNILHMAFEANPYFYSTNKIEELIKLGIDIDMLHSEDHNGNTPLFLLMKYNCNNIMHSCLSLGANRDEYLKLCIQMDKEPISVNIEDTDDSQSPIQIRYRVYFAESLVIRLLDSLV